MTITEPTTGFSSEQIVSKTTATYFEIPKFASSVLGCPVSLYEAVDSSGNVITDLTIT
jgi:hypothetical protein